MKKTLLILSFALLTEIIIAQVPKTVNCTTAGTLNTLLTHSEATTVTNFTVTGNIDARDVYFMRDSMPVLSVVNIGGVQIKAYGGSPDNILPISSFAHKTTLTSITLPTGSISIGDTAFAGCIGLTGNLTIPNNVTSIGAAAYKNCSGFKGSIIIGNSVTSIGDSAFANCFGVAGGLTLGNSVTSIGNYAFGDDLWLTGSLNIPVSVISIGDGAFGGCDFTGSLTIPNFVTSIGKYAFDDNEFTGNLTLGNSIKTIGDYSFNVFEGFSGPLTIPESVISIGDGAFGGCAFTGSLTLGNSITYIGDHAFAGCSGFTGSLTIPNSVTTIRYEAFEGCSGFTGNLTISNSLTRIEYATFQSCNGLTGSLTIPNSVNLIAGSAFDGCSGFTGSLTLGNSVSNIGGAFIDCSGFTGPLTIPASVTTMGGSFYNCKSLQKIIAFSSLPVVIDQYTFYNVNKTTCELHVPRGSKAAYKAADYWKEFNIIIDSVEMDTVIFNSQGGSSVDSIVTFFYTTISEPTTPSKTGYTFVGWYKESAYINEWNFATDKVIQDTTLYAKWTINSYTVNYNSQGGSTIGDANANYNTTITKPESPSETGYTFSGWYKESACINEWDFATDKITKDTTLYAKWSINNYTVVFNSQGGSVIADEKANYNTTIADPTAPIRTGYTFSGWYKEAACTNAWDFTTYKVITNITLYAKWIKNTGISINKTLSGIKLYPNPATDQIEISGAAIKQVTICNPLGKIVKQINVNCMDNVQINISQLNPGVYLIKVISTSSESTVLELLKY